MKCDFCNSAVRHPISFGCKTFTIKWAGYESVGAWCACPPCAMLVYADRWDELISRVLEKDPAKTMSPDVHKTFLDVLYRRFRANRL